MCFKRENQDRTWCIQHNSLLQLLPKLIKLIITPRTHEGRPTKITIPESDQTQREKNL